MFQSGVVERQSDNRDIILGKVFAPQELPNTYLPDMSWFHRHWQSDKPMCGSFAGSHYKQITQHYDSSAEQVDLSPAFLWKKIKEIDGIKPEDGTSSIAIFKTLSSVGISKYGLVNEDIKQTLEQLTYNDVSNEANEDAQIRIDKAYGFTTVPTFEDIKQEINRKNSCILILRGDDGFWHNSEPTFNTIKWGHFVVATGWKEDFIRILDSAEKKDEYGEKFIHKSYLPSKFCPELSSSIDCPDWLVKNLISQISLYRELFSLYAKLIALKGRK